jgi:DNA-binding CsgD family transcriptional regulator
MADDSTGPAIPLTPREEEVVKLIAEAHTNAQIAEILHLSEKTVESHRANVLRKLGMRDRVELVRYAIQAGAGRTVGGAPLSGCSGGVSGELAMLSRGECLSLLDHLVGGDLHGRPGGQHRLDRGGIQTLEAYGSQRIGGRTLSPHRAERVRFGATTHQEPVYRPR